MRAQLARYLRDQARRPFRWGEADCGMFVAGWAALLTGRDAGQPMRGRYASEAELSALMGPLGLPRLVDRLARAAGLSRQRSPQPGDIGVVVAGGQLVCGICSPRGWLVRGDRAVMRVEAERVVMGWGRRC